MGKKYQQIERQLKHNNISSLWAQADLDNQLRSHNSSSLGGATCRDPLWLWSGPSLVFVWRPTKDKRTLIYLSTSY